MKEIYKRCCL